MSRISMNVEGLEFRRFLSVTPAAVDDGSVDPGPILSPIDVVVPIAVAVPVPTEGGVTLYQFAKQHFTKRIGEFHLKVSDLALTAVINWGDGTHSAGTIAGSYATGDRYVVGGHTYAHAGTFAVDVQVFASPLGSPIHPTDPIVEFHSVIKAKNLKPTAGGKNLTEVAAEKFTDKIGEFTFKTVDQLINAVIDWGDGTHSAGKLVGSYNSGKFYVQGTHTYAHNGLYKVDVQILSHLAGNPNAPSFAVAKFTSVIAVKDQA